MNERFEGELAMLQEFYDSWVAYHTIPKERKDSQKVMGEQLLQLHANLQLGYEPRTVSS